MDDFYHAEPGQSFSVDYELSDDRVSKSDPTIYLKVSSVLLVRAGLFLSQVSSIPSSNIQILIFQNIIDLAINTVVYSLIGYLFAFGKDFGSFVGIYGFLSDSTNKSEFIEGWLIVIAASGLMVAAVGDRISFFSSVLLNILVSGLVFPLFIHWILSESGWMRVQKFAEVHVSYKDYSYSCLIHMSGGFLAFMSLIVLNKRLLRFKDMDVCSIPENGPSLTLFGNFFVVVGFLGLGIPTERYILTHLNFNFYGIVIVNMLLSAFSSVTTTLLLTFACPCEPLHKWTGMRSIQAAISGVAVIAGGADVYYPMAALLIGLFNGIIFFFVSFLVNISPIEDFSNIIACHFVSGFIGTILPPIFGVREGFNNSQYFAFMHTSWQILCDLPILGLIASVFLPFMYLLDYLSVLRSWDEDINHRRALTASKTMKSTSMLGRMFDWRGQNQQIGYLEPGYKARERSPQEDVPDIQEHPQEKVDVLFEKKPSPTKLDEKKDMEVLEDVGISRLEHFETEERYVVNYVMNSRPMTFFEELNSDSRRTSETMVKDCGETMAKNSKFFDIKLIKGIRNISDSKLFQKFKDNWTIPKRRTVWNRERELRFGSMSNIWVPSAVRISLETQV